VTETETETALERAGTVIGRGRQCGIEVRRGRGRGAGAEIGMTIRNPVPMIGVTKRDIIRAVTDGEGQTHLPSLGHSHVRPHHHSGSIDPKGRDHPTEDVDHSEKKTEDQGPDLAHIHRHATSTPTMTQSAQRNPGIARNRNYNGENQLVRTAKRTEMI